MRALLTGLFLLCASSPGWAARVKLLVPPGMPERPEHARLAAELDRAAGEMAARIPLTLDRPVTVFVEPDHVAQGKSTGEVGAAVPGRDADFHVVLHPDDGFAYRHGLARVLLARAGIDAAPALKRGAALWLSRGWYGRPYPEWLPFLAAACVLPEADDLLEDTEPGDASAVLWTPAAAAVIERLPGRTLSEKLAQAPPSGRVAGILASFASKPLPSWKPVPRPKLFLKGVSLAMLNRLEAGYHAPAVGRQLDRLAALGANAVSLMPFAYQSGPARPDLRYLNRGPGSETDAGLIHATRLARSRGFHVLYKPHLWLSGGSWPGEVEMRSEADWALWWKSYRRYVIHHAFLARWAGADLFSVGVELGRTVGREREWRDLIAATRLFFPGAVTYSANWYRDLENVKFWDRLDFIGVDAYFPLSASPTATRAELDRGAREVTARLAAASRQHGKPVLLTEVGFAARRAAWVNPHEEGGDYSEEDQALAYQALFAALGRKPWLAGTFVWKAFSGERGDRGDRGPEADFRFLGRRAEGVVRDYFQKAGIIARP